MFCLLGGSGSWIVDRGPCFQGTRDPSTCHPCPVGSAPAPVNCSAKLRPPRVATRSGTLCLCARGDLSSYLQLALLPESYGLIIFSFLKTLCLGCCRSFAQSWLSLRPHGLRRARLPCPSPPPGASLKLMSRCLLRLCVEV